MPAGVSFRKVTALPAEPATPDGLYFLLCDDAHSFRLFLANQDGMLIAARLAPIHMTIRAVGGLVPADTEIGRYLATENIELDVLISGMVAEDAATNEAVFTVWRGVDMVARMTFAPGAAQAGVEILMMPVPKDSLLIFRTPVNQDPTLSNVTGTLGARRT